MMIEESLPSESIILRFDRDLRTNCALFHMEVVRMRRSVEETLNNAGIRQAETMQVMHSSS
jgi:hypothetical protein